MAWRCTEKPLLQAHFFTELIISCRELTLGGTPTWVLSEGKRSLIVKLRVLLALLTGPGHYMCLQTHQI